MKIHKVNKGKTRKSNQFLLYLLGLDSGDRKALDAKFKPTDAPPCQFDKEDLRFVLKGKVYFQTSPGLRINESLI